jgi:hypothetical protein
MLDEDFEFEFEDFDIRLLDILKAIGGRDE